MNILKMTLKVKFLLNIKQIILSIKISPKSMKLVLTKKSIIIFSKKDINN